MMKVLLIDPSDLKSVYGKLGRRLKPVAPSLGLLYVAAVAEEAGYDVSVIDGYGDQLSVDEIVQKATAINPDIIGVTCTTTTFGVTVKCMQQLKGKIPKAITVLGGAHISSDGRNTLKNCPEIDIGVIGEGEYTFLDILNGIELQQIPGIVFRDQDGAIIQTAPRPFIEDLDSIPFPARHHVNLKSYGNPIYDVYVPFMTSIISSRGCPHNCTFCGSYKVFGKRTRFRSAENVAAELDLLKNEYGVQGVHFRDDTFTMNLKRFYKVCDALKERGLKWTGNSRADKHMNHKLLSKMKESGCSLLLVGVESGDPEVLKNYKKGTSIDHTKKFFNWANELKIDLHASFIFGSPVETKDSIQRTLEFAKELKPTIATFFILNPFPGTPIYDDMVSAELMEQMDWSELNSPKFFNPIIDNPNFSREELKIDVKRAHRKFYFRISYIWDQLKSINSFHMLRLRLSTATTLLKLVT